MIMEYFKDAEKNLFRPDLLDKDALTASTKIVEESKDKRGFSRFSLSSSQLRKFFNEFRNLEKKANTTDDFQKILPLVKLVKSKAEYYRGKNSISKEFKDFLHDNVNSIHDKRDFEAFMLYFEAIVGYCYGKPGFHKN